MPRHTALIVDADSSHTEALSALLADRGYQTAQAGTAAAARDALALAPPDVLLLNLQCSGDALSVLEHERIDDVTEILVMADSDQAGHATRAANAGATYYFCKPFNEPFLTELLDDVAAELETNQSDPTQVPDLPPLDQFGLLRGSARPMRKLYRVLRKVAQTDTTVLVVGESGTGKELVAQTLHQLSARAAGPFVAMNCGAVPADLIESELFGHEKGAFSGADKIHRGFFERAEGGTLFLDEITEMPIDLQVKLLRVLEMSQFRRVGGEKVFDADVRIVAATNRQPEQAVADNRMREDLYFRLAQFPVHLPPLRNRGDDIKGLALHFLKELNAEHDTHVGFSEAAVDSLMEHSWPGNVRELRAFVRRAYILAGDKVELDDLPDFGDSSGPLDDGEALTVRVGSSLADVERRLIFATLEANDGDKKTTADILGVSLKTLYNRLKAYAEEAEAEAEAEAAEACKAQGTAAATDSA